MPALLCVRKKYVYLSFLFLVFVAGIVLFSGLSNSASISLNSRASSYPSPTPKKIQSVIYGGTEVTDSNKWPFMVRLFTHSKDESTFNPFDYGFCGGAIIAQNWVLTAAHCVNYKKSDEIFVFTGSATLPDGDKVKTPADQVFSVKEIVYQPTLWRRVYSTNSILYVFDLALLRLDRSISNKDKSTNIISLNTKSSLEAEGRMTVALGWGMTESTRMPVTLRQVAVPIVANARVNKNINPFNIAKDHNMTDAELAIGYPNKANAGTCFGDSGGPIIAWDGTKWVLLGITSWVEGIKLANSSVPTCETSHIRAASRLSFTGIVPVNGFEVEINYFKWIKDTIDLRRSGFLEASYKGNGNYKGIELMPSERHDYDMLKCDTEVWNNDLPELCKFHTRGR